jgi:hypothetical protein
MTIERTTVEGRKATVAYILDDFTPTTPDKATLIKVLFDDGDILFVIPARDAPQPARDAQL